MLFSYFGYLLQLLRWILPEGRSGVIIVNFEQLSHCSGDSTVDFEQPNTT